MNHAQRWRKNRNSAMTIPDAAERTLVGGEVKQSLPNRQPPLPAVPATVPEAVTAGNSH